MIEEPATVIDKDSTIHPDILYVAMIAININLAVAMMEKNKGKVDETTARALSTSFQLPNMLAMASALIVCIRPLLVDKTIDLSSAVKVMYEKNKDVNSQMTIEEVTGFFEGTLDLGMSKIILDS